MYFWEIQNAKMEIKSNASKNEFFDMNKVKTYNIVVQLIESLTFYVKFASFMKKNWNVSPEKVWGRYIKKSFSCTCNIKMFQRRMENGCCEKIIKRKEQKRNFKRICSCIHARKCTHIRAMWQYSVASLAVQVLRDHPFILSFYRERLFIFIQHFRWLFFSMIVTASEDLDILMYVHIFLFVRRIKFSFKCEHLQKQYMVMAWHF